MDVKLRIDHKGEPRVVICDGAVEHYLDSTTSARLLLARLTAIIQAADEVELSRVRPA